MPRGKKVTAEQIIGELREAEVELARGKTVPEAVRNLGVTEQTYYRRKREYGRLRRDQAKRLKDREKENARLKRLLADAEVDGLTFRCHTLETEGEGYRPQDAKRRRRADCRGNRTNRDTPTASGEIDTTTRHHVRPLRVAVFSRRQHSGSLKSIRGAGCRSVCLDFHDDCVQRVECVGLSSVKGFQSPLDLREREDRGCLDRLVTERSH